LGLLPRRERAQPRPLGEGDLGAQGQDARAHPPVQLEKAVGVGCGRLRPDRRRRLARVRDAGAYNEESLVEFLGELHHHLHGDKVTLLWDGLPSHRSKLMQAYIASQRHWLVVERLPAYAPDLNPVEGLWGNLKGTELANFCPLTIDEAATAADAGLCRVGQDAQLCWAFLRHAGLSL
jgi:transposase